MGSIRLKIDEATMSSVLTPILTERVREQIESNVGLAAAIEEAISQAVISMICGLMVGKPGEYDSEGRKAWEKAEAVYAGEGEAPEELVPVEASGGEGQAPACVAKTSSGSPDGEDVPF